MNDFSELEAELKKLRPRPMSPDLSARIEISLAQEAAGRGTATAGVLPKEQKRFRMNWMGLGLGLAAAATFLLLARVNVDRPSKSPGLALLTPAPLTPAAKAVNEFVPSALTQVVYDTKDEGLHYTNGSDEPMRRVRSRKRETVQWKNPQTGASLRVTYPKEEVTLIPVSGQ
ncbi:MAG TPA: hypothetical protein VM940_03275 [Chthoniobacterales bacterium]|jgi:hypothetical protein|nr:hypothetical protein [Chthoniobacterales bacterium]